MTLVPDASAVLSWLLSDERDDRALAMLKGIGDQRLLVPAIWRSELQNALLAAERRSRISPEDCNVLLRDAEALGIESDTRNAGQDLCSEVVIARKFDLSAYDAAYLELALRRGAKLMTRDEHLARAAASLGLLWEADG